MSMHLTVYVGPYLVVPKNSKFNLDDWCEAFCSGRGESGYTEDGWYLIPNRDVDGIDRVMSFDRYSDNDTVTSIDLGAQVYEMSAMRQLAAKLIAWCNENNVPFRVEWGVVPGWF